MLKFAWNGVTKKKMVFNKPTTPLLSLELFKKTSYDFSSSQIFSSETLKDPGIYISNNLEWSHHIVRKMKTCYSTYK